MKDVVCRICGSTASCECWQSFESPSAEICKRLEQRFSEITREDGHRCGELMAGVVMFSVSSILWCHQRMEGTPEALETVIAQLSHVLRANQHTDLFRPGGEFPS